MRTLAPRGVTLVEVLVAAAVFAALFLPLLTLFSSTTRHVGTEIIFARAVGLADELLSQVAHIHRRLGRLDVVPGRDHVGGRSPTGELDLETYLRTFERNAGVILLPGEPEDTRGSRVFISPSQRGFRRFLTVKAVQVAAPRRNTSPDRLWVARVRVEYDLVIDNRDVTREFGLQSYYFQRCAPQRKFRPPE